MKLYPNESGEVKSQRILEEFDNFQREYRDKIWVGMKRVIIHIVDSLPYQTDYKKILAEIYKNNRAYEQVCQDADLGDKFAKHILKCMDEAITEWIIRDSPPQRLKEMMRPRYWPGSLAYYMHQDERYDDDIDLAPFRAKASSMTSRAVKCASKAGSVFFPAIDCINPMMLFQQDSWTHYTVRERLRDSHAFDRGDDKSIRWIDDQRKEIGRGGLYDYYDDYGSCEAYQSYEDFSYGKLHSIRSDQSVHTQAADIAAGFARQAYERHGIVAIAGSFDYVTINGERITQNNAEEKFELWRQLIEREQREKQQIIINI
jgi:hypothetical protein